TSLTMPPNFSAFRDCLTQAFHVGLLSALKPKITHSTLGECLRILAYSASGIRKHAVPAGQRRTRYAAASAAAPAGLSISTFTAFRRLTSSAYARSLIS